MLGTSDKYIMVIALAPYLTLAAYDGWLHEKARQVPAIEKLLHAALAISGVALVAALFSGNSNVAWSCLAVFVVVGGIDEFGFHGPLSSHERRLHCAAYACFAAFIGVALWRGAMPWP
jgi:hypothetical protein